MYGHDVVYGVVDCTYVFFFARSRSLSLLSIFSKCVGWEYSCISILYERWAYRVVCVGFVRVLHTQTRERIYTFHIFTTKLQISVRSAISPFCTVQFSFPFFQFSLSVFHVHSMGIWLITPSWTNEHMLERSAIRVENDKWIKRHVIENILYVNWYSKVNMQICADAGKYVFAWPWHMHIAYK